MTKTKGLIVVGFFNATTKVYNWKKLRAMRSLECGEHVPIVTLNNWFDVPGYGDMKPEYVFHVHQTEDMDKKWIHRVVSRCNAEKTMSIVAVHEEDINQYKGLLRYTLMDMEWYREKYGKGLTVWGSTFDYILRWAFEQGYRKIFLEGFMMIDLDKHGECEFQLPIMMNTIDSLIEKQVVFKFPLYIAWKRMLKLFPSRFMDWSKLVDMNIKEYGRLTGSMKDLFSEKNKIKVQLGGKNGNN